MPLIRAFGRWLRSHSTDESSRFSRTGDLSETPLSAMVMTSAVIFVAALGIVPIVVAGSAYEGVRRLDRPNLIGERGHWVAAVVVAIAVGVALVLLVRGSG